MVSYRAPTDPVILLRYRVWCSVKDCTCWCPVRITDSALMSRGGELMGNTSLMHAKHCEHTGQRAKVRVQEVVRPLQLDERMIALAGAISIDFDYFSQHSHGPGKLSTSSQGLL